MPRTANFKDVELERLLSIVAEVLPYGGTMWATVTAEYNRRLPRGVIARDQESLKSKFDRMKNAPKPTGTGVMPVQIARAKEIWQEIQSRNEAGENSDTVGSDDEGLGEEPGEEAGEEAGHESESEDAARTQPASVLPSSDAPAGYSFSRLGHDDLVAIGSTRSGSVSSQAAIKRRRHNEILEKSQASLDAQPQSSGLEAFMIMFANQQKADADRRAEEREERKYQEDEREQQRLIREEIRNEERRLEVEERRRQHESDMEERRRQHEMMMLAIMKKD